MQYPVSAFPAHVSSGLLLCKCAYNSFITDVPGAVNPAGFPRPLTICINLLQQSGQYFCFFALLYEIYYEPKPVT